MKTSNATIHTRSNPLPPPRHRLFRHAGIVMCLLLSAATLAAPAHAQAPGPNHSTIAYFRANNVALMNSTGGGSRFVTTRGTGYTAGNSITYPSYAWSPDGRYLLLVKQTISGRSAPVSEMLLLDAQGTIIRSLGQTLSSADFDPHWAVDADQIAYLATQHFVSNRIGFRQTINSIDLQGHARFLATYDAHEGCGGGTGDPAAIVWWGETGFGGTRTTLLWSQSRHLLIHSGDCGSGLWMTDTLRHVARRLGTVRQPWQEATLSTTGLLAVTVRSNSPNPIDLNRVALVNPRTNQILRLLGPGELPAWSPDGTSLYFVRRTPGKTLHFVDSLGNRPESQTFTSTIWRTDASGGHATRLLRQDAYALGPLQVAADGRSLIFSRVDNAWKLWRLSLTGRHYTGAVAQQYGPKVRIERLVPGTSVTVLAWNAGRPAVRP